MIVIIPNAFYSRPELKTLLKGIVDWDDLASRLNMDKVTRNAYWGQTIIDAMNGAGSAPVIEPKPVSRGRKSKSYDLVDEAIEAQGKGGRR